MGWPGARCYTSSRVEAQRSRAHNLRAGGSADDVTPSAQRDWRGGRDGSSELEQMADAPSVRPDRSRVVLINMPTQRCRCRSILNVHTRRSDKAAPAASPTKVRVPQFVPDEGKLLHTSTRRGVALALRGQHRGIESRRLRSEAIPHRSIHKQSTNSMATAKKGARKPTLNIDSAEGAARSSREPFIWPLTWRAS